MHTDNWPQESQSFLEKIGKELADKRIVVTGGASFIGSHLVEALLDLGCNVLVLDDLSSGSLKFLPPPTSNLSFERINLIHNQELPQYFSGAEIVFHLAAIHGGRGFIEKQQRAILQNIRIDNLVFDTAVNCGVKKIVYASSACAYPINLQNSSTELNYLSEKDADIFGKDYSEPDGVYGFTKLLGEYQLQNYTKGSQTKSVAARIFTSYGPRENESHAAIALIAKALLGMEPFKIWGDGNQTRNFTYVTDTVCGLLASALFKSKNDFEVLNVGTSVHSTVMNFVETVFKILQKDLPSFDFQINKPAGVASRASNNDKIIGEFSWSPAVDLPSGIKSTVSWYSNLSDRPQNLFELEQVLESR